MAGTLMEKIRDRLIDDWKQAWKLWSVQLSSLAFMVMLAAEILGSGWQQLPQEVRDNIPHAVTIGLVLNGLTILARIFNQIKGTKDGTDQ